MQGYSQSISRVQASVKPRGLELLTELEGHRAGAVGDDVGLGTADLGGAFGVAVDVRAGVRGVQQGQLERPVVLGDAGGEVEGGIALLLAEDAALGGAQISPAGRLANHRPLEM